MRNVNKRKIVITLCIIVGVGAICFGVKEIMGQLVGSIRKNTDFNIESLRWTIIGAIGSWIGSVFGAIALIVSLLAFWFPQRIKIAVSIRSGTMISQVPRDNNIEIYIITVKNVGIRPITVNNVYLHFGGKNPRDIFIGVLNQGSALQIHTPMFPKRLDQGEAFDYYLLREKLDIALAHYEEKTSLSTPLSIRVDEVIKGTQYYKTKWTLGTFIGGECK